jgi:small-conductance mechanosensitive channel
MLEFSLELVETIAVIVIMIVIHLLSKSAISRALKTFKFTVQRRRIIVKLINFVVFVFGTITIAAIWGIKQSELFIFLSSVITVIGIAFFAQWSLLSNITSALILFFNHPIKIGDRIEIHDKEYPLSGVVKDIGYYFVRIENTTNEVITIPNSIFLQKMVTVKTQSA